MVAFTLAQQKASAAGGVLPRQRLMWPPVTIFVISWPITGSGGMTTACAITANTQGNDLLSGSDLFILVLNVQIVHQQSSCYMR